MTFIERPRNQKKPGPSTTTMTRSGDGIHGNGMMVMIMEVVGKLTDDED